MANKNIRHKKINLKLAIQLLIITTILASITSMARFSETFGSNGSAIVAVPIFSSTTINLTNVYPEMDPIEYDLIIKNKNGLKISEVALGYQIEIINIGNLPLNIELFNVDDQSNVIGENLLNLRQPVTGQMYVTETTHNYKLIISWDKSEVNNYNNHKYNKESNYIKINIDAVQKD